MSIQSAFESLSRVSLSARIIAGLGLGIFVGLFFGEPAAVLQPVADIYIRLMQMTVLPYLVIALIIGFGQLEAAEAKRLALRGGALLLMTWLLTFAVIAATVPVRTHVTDPGDNEPGWLYLPPELC